MLVFTKPSCLGSGDYSENSVIFPAHSFNVGRVNFLIDERNVLPRPYEPKWGADGNFIKAYQGLLNVTNQSINPHGGSLDHRSFGLDFGVFAVRLRGFEGKETGTVSIEVGFDEAVPECISALFIAEFKSCVTIDSNRMVQQFDY